MRHSRARSRSGTGAEAPAKKRNSLDRAPKSIALPLFIEAHLVRFWERAKRFLMRTLSDEVEQWKLNCY
jgi:hypothetical protein